MFLKLRLELFYSGFNVPEPSQIPGRMLSSYEETKPDVTSPVCRTARDEKVALLGDALRIFEHEDAPETADANQPGRIRLSLHCMGELLELCPILQP